MIGNTVWVWSGRNKGLQGKIIADNNSEYLVDFDRKIKLKEFDMILSDSYWIKHKDVEVIDD